MSLRLVSRQRDVSAHLAQEFALTTAEAVRRPASGDQHAEHLAFDSQGRRDHRAKAATGELLRKRKLHLVDIGLIDQISFDAARKAILVDRDARLLGQSELQCQGFTTETYAHDSKHLVDRVIRADAAEVDGQVVLQASNYDLEDAR